MTVRQEFPCPVHSRHGARDRACGASTEKSVEVRGLDAIRILNRLDCAARSGFDGSSSRHGGPAHAEQHALDLLRGAQPPIVIVCEVVHDLTLADGDVHEPSHEANGCLYIS